MKSITLRKIPPELRRKLEEQARADGASLAKAVLKLLEECTGIRKRNRRVLHHDLDFLAGTWTEAEASAFEKTLSEQRKIAPELWR
jgi:hypothetical protein